MQVSLAEVLGERFNEIFSKSPQCVPRGLVIMIHLACRRSWVQIGQNLFFFSLLFSFSFSFPSVFFLVIIAVFFCFFIYCIYLAISQAIFTQIEAKVQWNSSPRGENYLSLWPIVFYKKCFSVHWNSTKMGMYSLTSRAYSPGKRLNQLLYYKSEC